MKKRVFLILGVILVISLLLSVTPVLATTSAPTVTATSASSVSYATATFNGNITSLGGASSAKERGFVWGTKSGGPYTKKWFTDGTYTTGAFTHIQLNMTPGTTYYYKAYAKNVAGISYSAEETFDTTNVAPPTVTTTASGTLTKKTAVVGGNVTSTNGVKPTHIGIEYGTTTGVYTKSLMSGAIGSAGTGAFSKTLSGLTTGTEYFYKAFAYSQGPGVSIIKSASSTSGTATQVSTQHEDGRFSIALTHTAVAGSVYLRFANPEGNFFLSNLTTLTAATEFSFWYMMPADYSGDAGPEIALRFLEPGGTGSVSVTIMPLQGANMIADGAWHKCTLTSSTISCIYTGVDPTAGVAFTYNTGGLALSGVVASINGQTAMTNAQASASNWKLSRVTIALYEGQVRTCYIDDPTINGTTIQLEGALSQTIREGVGVEDNFTTP